MLTVSEELGALVELFLSLVAIGLSMFTGNLLLDALDNLTASAAA
ncbi:hypothetical protein QCE73_36650 [Caballeronia sp. LZ029]|nr:hypothetical protein [Caballeronia sp. LZ029]MDR5748717.1 hypothetical protein [Caballeronia sp. LZ029]